MKTCLQQYPNTSTSQVNEISIRKYTSGETTSIIIGFGHDNSFQQRGY